MPFLRRQRRPPSTSCARLQSRQFHAHAGYAQGSCSMVSDQPAREADQNRRQSRQPRSLRHFPVSRSCRATADVPADPVTHCAIAGARTSVRGPGIKCNGQRRLRCGLMKANQRVPAPRGRRTHSFGSTWRRSRGKLLLWMFLHQTIAFADAGIGKCRLRRHSRAFIYVVARIVLAQQQRGYPGNAELELSRRCPQ